MHRIAKPAAVLALAVLSVSACGGGGGDNAVKGVVVDAVVQDGNVNVTALDDDGAFLAFLDTARTDADGLFVAKGQRGVMRLEVGTGSYTDPATGKTIQLAPRGGVLRAMVPDKGFFTISPFSTISFVATTQQIAVLGRTAPEAIASANELVGEAFSVGAVQFDPIETVPADLEDPLQAEEGLTPEKLYAALLGGLAEVARSMDQKANPAGQGLISPTEVASALAIDARDGAIDGVDGTEDPPAPVLIEGVELVPAGQTFGEILGQGVLDIQANVIAGFDGLLASEAAQIDAALTATGIPVFNVLQPAIDTVESDFDGTPDQIHQSGGDQITITGENFQSNAQVFIDEVEAVNVVVIGSTVITAFASLDVSDVTENTGLRTVTVVNPDETAASLVDGIRLIGAPINGLALQFSALNDEVSVDVGGTVQVDSATQIVDANGFPVLPDEVIDLASVFTADDAGAGTEASLSAASVLTDANSNIAFDILVGEQSGTLEVTATAAAPGTATSSRTLTIFPGETTDIDLVTGKDTLIADGVDSTTATATFTDQFGNKIIDGTTIDATVLDGDLDGLGLASSADIVAGVVTFTYTAPTDVDDGEDTLTVTDASVPISEFVVLTLIPGAPDLIVLDQQNDDIVLSSDGTLDGAPKTITFTGTVFDAQGNEVLAGVTLDVSLTGPITVGGQQVVQVDTIGDGTFAVIDVTADDDIGGVGEAAGQAASITITEAGTGTQALKDQDFVVVPGDAATVVLDTPPALVVNETGQVTVTVTDSNDNVLREGTTVSFTKTNAGSNLAGSTGVGPIDVVLLQNGTVTVDLIAPSVAPADDTITATVANTTLADAFDTQVVNYLVAAPAQIVNFDIDEDFISVDGGTNGPNLATVTGNVQDADGNPVEGAVVEITVADDVVAPVTVQQAVNADGLFSFQVTPAQKLLTAQPGLAGTGTITVTELSQNVVAGGPGAGDITVNPGDPFTVAFDDAPTITVTAQDAARSFDGTVKDVEDNFVLDGELITFAISALTNAIDGDVIDASNTTSAGRFTVNARLTNSTDDPTITATADTGVFADLIVDVVPAEPADIAIDDISAVPLNLGPPQETAAVTGAVEDAFGNGVEGATVTLEVGDTDVGTLTIGVTTDLASGDVTTDANGGFAATFEGNTLADTTTITATVSNGDVVNPVFFDDFTFVTTEAGFLKTLALDAPNVISDVVDDAVGTTLVEYTGTAVDSFGNDVANGTPITAVIVAPRTDGVLVSTFVTDGGTFQIDLEQVTVKGDLTITVSDPADPAGLVVAAVTSDLVVFLADIPAVIRDAASTGGVLDTTEENLVVEVPGDPGETATVSGFVFDRFDNIANENTPITMTVDNVATDSSFDPVVATTDVDGFFSTVFTAGTTAQLETVFADAGGGVTAEVDITLLANVPAAFAIEAVTTPVNDDPTRATADGQNEVVFQSVGQILDGSGNPIQDDPVETFTISFDAVGPVDLGDAVVAGSVLTFTVQGGLTVDSFVVTATADNFLVVAESASADLIVEEHVLTPTFQTTSDFTAPILLLGDVNNDGALDIVEVSETDVFTTFTDGDGGEDATAAAVAIAAVNAGVLFDVDLDGFLDLVLATADGLTVQPFDPGAGNFVAVPTVQAPDGGGTAFVDVQVVDFDDDGFVDLAGISGTQVSIFAGDAIGSVDAVTAPLNVDFGTGPVRFEVDDVTANGFKDLVVFGDGELFVAQNVSSTLGITFETSFGTPIDDDTTDMDLGDVDRDGDVDVVMTIGGANPRVQVRENTGLDDEERYTETADILPLFDIDSMDTVRIADIDRNGQPDLLVGVADIDDPAIGRVSLFRQDAAGDAIFVEDMITTFNFEINAGTLFEVGDVDRDGIADLVGSVNVISLAGGPVDQTGAGVASGVGGDLVPVYDAPQTQAIAGVAGITVGDFLLDGGDDVTAISNQGAQGVSTTLNFEGEDTFDLVVGGNVVNVPFGFAELFAADFNRDGTLDLAYNDVGVVINPGASIILNDVFIDNSLGNFRPAGVPQVVQVFDDSPVTTGVGTSKDGDIEIGTAVVDEVDVDLVVDDGEVAGVERVAVMIFDIRRFQEGLIDDADLTILETSNSGFDYDVFVSLSGTGANDQIELADIQGGSAFVDDRTDNGSLETFDVTGFVANAVANGDDHITFFVVSQDNVPAVNEVITFEAIDDLVGTDPPALQIDQVPLHDFSVGGTFAAGDGADLVVHARATGTNEIRVAVNDGQSDPVLTLAGAGVATDPLGGTPFRGVTGYFDDDDHIDLAYIAGDALIKRDVVLLFGDPHDEEGDSDLFKTPPVEPQITSSEINFPGFRAIASGDFDRDGTDDLVLVQPDEITVLTSRDDGTRFQSLAQESIGDNPTAVASGDFNQDGLLDFVFAETIVGVEVLLHFFHGTGDPVDAFVEQPDALVLGIAAGDVTVITVTDLNQDGLPDVSAMQEGGAVSVFLTTP